MIRAIVGWLTLWGRPPDPPARCPFVVIGKRPVEVGPHHTTPYARGRAMDWFLALTMAGIAAWLAQPGGAPIQVGTPGSWAASLSRESWTVVFIGLAVVRVASILINGHWRSGTSALIRGGAAFLGAIFWSQIVYYIVIAGLQSTSGRLNLLVLWFGSLLIGDAFCAIRAAIDFVLIRTARRVVFDGTS